MASGFLVPLLKPEEADQTLFANSVSFRLEVLTPLSVPHTLNTGRRSSGHCLQKLKRTTNQQMCRARDIGWKHKTDHQMPAEELGWYSRKYGHSKVATCKEDLRRLHAYTGKMHIQKSPEKTVSLHLRLIHRLWVSLVNLWRATPAQNSLQRLGYEGVLFLVFP